MPRKINVEIAMYPCPLDQIVHTALVVIYVDGAGL